MSPLPDSQPWLHTAVSWRAFFFFLNLDSWILPLRGSNLVVPDWVQASRLKKYLPGELNEQPA